MNLRWLTLCASVALLPHLALSAMPAAERQDGTGLTFRTGVDLVALNVTLTDQNHRFVGGVTEQEFAVFEDGVQQNISYFAVGRIPLDLAILLDTSSSMVNTLPTAQDAAVGFVKTAQTGDRVSVIEITSRANVLNPLSEDFAAAVHAIRKTYAQGSTALYNALYLAMTDMVRSRKDIKDIRRQAIAVLSDGQDTASVVQYDDVLSLARESGIAIYTIALVAPAEAWRLSDTKANSQPQFIMRSLAQETGAQSFVAQSASQLTTIYDTIANELAQQYTIGYVSSNPNRNGGYRKVMVKVLDHPGVAARTRSGYQAPRARPTGAPR